MNNTPAQITEIKNRLEHALTRIDAQGLAAFRKNPRRYHNPYALGIMFNRVADIVKDLEAGADPRLAIIAGFTGPIVDKCLKACDLAKSDVTSETMVKRSYKGMPCYQPVKAVDSEVETEGETV